MGAVRVFMKWVKMVSELGLSSVPCALRIVLFPGLVAASFYYSMLVWLLLAMSRKEHRVAMRCAVAVR